MRLAAFESNSGARVGIVEEDVLHPLPPEHEMVAVLGMDPEAREVLASGARASGDVIALEDVRLLPPLRPTTLRDFICFEQHVEGIVKITSPDAEVMPDWYDAPTFYFSSTNAVFGPGDEIEVPPGCELLDFELEVAAVIGRAGRDLRPEQAWEQIAGFTIYDDFSNRDAGGREARMGVGWAKAKDFANVLGPWVVTTDELLPYRADDRLQLGCVATRNGEEIGRDSLASMAWSFEEMLVYASRGAELRPGDVLGSGTCGSGCLAELWGRNGVIEPRPLQPGDEVTLSVEGIGTLTNTIVPGVEPVPVPRARPRAGAA
jgi:2-keto-4-pentenoate hydratase/2-oxohepta-3-ene-1,7-dioic acid hydratase in catechol pathway